MAKKYAASPVAGTTMGGHPAKAHAFAADGNVVKRQASVLVPTSNQKSGGKIGRPVAKDWPATGNAGLKPRPERLLINLALEDDADASGTTFVNDFDPPIEFRVPLNADEQAQDLKLVYWDGSAWAEVPDAWVVKSSGQKFWKQSNAGGGKDFVVQLSYWPSDPASGIYP